MSQARVVAVADQNARTFDDPVWQSLELEHTRIAVAWDIATGDPDTRAVRSLDAAIAADVNVLVTWMPSVKALPTKAEFTSAFVAFRRRWPAIREFATWNEPNLRGRRTASRPYLLVRYWKAMKANCPGCTVLAPELVDFPSAPAWARRFEKSLGHSKLTWGLHNYGDANRFRLLKESVTAKMLRAVKGSIWLTETGGLVDVPGFPYDEARAARATARVFKLADLSPERISRVYLYHWRAPPGGAGTWDSALLSGDDQPRPAFWTLTGVLGKTEAAQQALTARDLAGDPAPEPAEQFLGLRPRCILALKCGRTGKLIG
ncbi:MAG TPA: hypothetical protein VGR11_15545 [Solirubrobacteraceae bacterium]|nr:hypothetical protein [Solirubrobacteraceae bacterium]